jgi:hypothetical protein
LLPGLNDPQRKRALAELGRVCLARDEATEALSAWIEGGHAEDAAYVAERVLRLDELRAYVDEHCPDSGVRADEMLDATPAALRTEIRYLLARRLARFGQGEAAEVYFPENLRGVYHAYMSDVRTGFDLDRPTAERAEAFWRAAQAVHNHGMALLGTELDPDWAIWDGAYESSPTGDLRTGEARLTGGVWAPTPAELKRLSEHAVPQQRYHYRYRAADLAWWAASLLPNDLDETAGILSEAGNWLKNRDPQAAQRFYQALVIRCGHTSLGLAAAQEHWLPKNSL